MKRKASAKTEQQRERKRLQNRISQKCSREKQVGYIRHLEQFIESIKQSEGSAATEAAERLRLIRENQALRASLLHMRKRLLSLGAQVTSLASTIDHDGISSPPKIHDEPDDFPAPELRARDDETASGPLQQESPSSCPKERIPVEEPLALSPSPLDFSRGRIDDDDQPTRVDTDISTFFATNCLRFNPRTGVVICKPPNASTKSPLLLMEAKIQRTMAEFEPRTYHNTLCIRPFADDLSVADVQAFEEQILANIVHLAVLALVKTSRIGGYSHVLVSPKPRDGRALPISLTSFQ